MIKALDDEKIIEMFQMRSEGALDALSGKYGALVRTVARNILKSKQDAEECENDTYLACWKTIPPQNPASLKAYVLRVARNRAVAAYHANTAVKRNSFYDAAFEELSDCIPAAFSVESELEAQELAAGINAFLSALPREDRQIFVRRYNFADSIEAIANMFGLKAKTVAMRLFRLRKKLEKYLAEEGLINERL